MDYPKTQPGVGLLNGKFTDGNPATGLMPSRDPASWANSVTDELLNVIRAAGFEPDEARADQLLQAFQQLVDGGVANAGYLAADQNLGDLENVAEARDNLGLGTSADYDVQADPLDRTPGALMAVGGFGIGSGLDLRNSIYVTGTPADLYGCGFVVGMANGGSDGLAIPGLPASTYGTLTVSFPYVDESAWGSMSRTFQSGTFVWTQMVVDGNTWGAWTPQFNEGGGTVNGAVVIRTAQSQSSPGVRLINNDGGDAVISLETASTIASLSHSASKSGFAVRDAAGAPATFDAGSILSYGSACHSEVSFMKPATGQWVSLTGEGAIPAGGTWAYFAIQFNGSGQSLGPVSGIAAGGTASIGSNLNGFAWRIF